MSINPLNAQNLECLQHDVDLEQFNIDLLKEQRRIKDRIAELPEFPTLSPWKYAPLKSRRNILGNNASSDRQSQCDWDKKNVQIEDRINKTDSPFSQWISGNEMQRVVRKDEMVKIIKLQNDRMIHEMDILKRDLKTLHTTVSNQQQNQCDQYQVVGNECCNHSQSAKIKNVAKEVQEAYCGQHADVKSFVASLQRKYDETLSDLRGDPDRTRDRIDNDCWNTEEYSISGESEYHKNSNIKLLKSELRKNEMELFGMTKEIGMTRTRDQKIYRKMDGLIRSLRQRENTRVEALRQLLKRNAKRNEMLRAKLKSTRKKRQLRHVSQ